jgi:dual specificity tyrosine-phosphorylation-regulated kinase 2/3/4
LGVPYTAAIDMWSFGCILTELYTGIPIFPGESEHEQLSLIMQVAGLPPEHLLMQATRKANFFQENSNQPLYGCEDSTGNLRLPNTRPLVDILGNNGNDSFLDFISQCMEWDPEQRITPFQALLHPWIIEGLPAQVLVHH